MGHFIVGVLTGILICGVVMLVRCAAWYEHKHPEDDYWHGSLLYQRLYLCWKDCSDIRRSLQKNDEKSDKRVNQDYQKKKEQTYFASSIELLIVILENTGYLGYESPSQLYQDRIILITDMVGKGCLLCTENTKLLFF